jgi:hypothetical protein
MIPRMLGPLTRRATGIEGVRELGGGCEIEVVQGEVVVPTTVLGRTKKGARVVRLPLDEGELATTMVLKRAGESVRRGEPLLRKPGFFGLSNTEYVCPVDGYIEEILIPQRAVLIREQTADVRAGVWGTVAGVMPERGVVLRFDGTVLRFFAGWGPPVAGTLTAGVDLFSPADVSRYIGEEHRGKILWALSTVCAEAIVEAARVEVAGIVAGSIGLTELVRATAEVTARTGRAQLPLTLLISDGFGSAAMSPDFRRHLSGAVGRDIYLDNPVSGGGPGWALDPVVAFSPAPAERDGAVAAPAEPSVVKSGGGPRLPVPGDLVRTIDLEMFGRHGTVSGPLIERRLATGVTLWMAPVTLDDGIATELAVANLELLSGAPGGAQGR